MAFGNMGTGFLPTDPRTKKHPTGGSTSAAQPRDTSVISTGNPLDSGIGFASPSARGDLFSRATPTPAPNPEYTAKTASERTERAESRGVATTQQNMGTLAIDFRAAEQAKTDAGEQTTTQKRDAKVLDARSNAEHRRNVLDPAAKEASKFRAQAAGAKEYMDKFRTKANTASLAAKQNTSQRANMGLNLNASKRPSSSTRGAAPGLIEARRTGNTIGPDHSWLIPEMNKEFQENQENPDILALGSSREHSEAPATQPVGWEDMANAQSSSGRATPTQMAQAAVSMHARKSPNK